MTSITQANEVACQVHQLSTSRADTSHGPLTVGMGLPSGHLTHLQVGHVGRLVLVEANDRLTPLPETLDAHGERLFFTESANSQV